MTIQGQILEFFREKDVITTKEIYAKLNDKPQSSIRDACNHLVKEGKIERLSKGNFKIKVIA